MLASRDLQHAPAGWKGHALRSKFSHVNSDEFTAVASYTAQERANRLLLPVIAVVSCYHRQEPHGHSLHEEWAASIFCNGGWSGRWKAIGIRRPDLW